jgi:hypothetical protein
MYHLSNQNLEVTILDPVVDRERLGVRYCTGGYIFQVTDARFGPLLSGPTYPESFNWFDGQGIPDAFNLGPLLDPDGVDSLALVLGVGICDLDAREVDTFCEWEVGQETNAISFRTQHSFHSYTVALERTVTLTGRTIRSRTRVHNRGAAPFPMCWFPHPFYPQPDGDDLIKLNLPVAAIDHEAYSLGDNGYIARAGWPWSRGYYLPLDHTQDSPLVVLQRHPVLGLAAAICSYAPTYFPIWGNPNTFSWEPFLERTIGMGQSLTWWIDYEF